MDTDCQISNTMTKNEKDEKPGRRIGNSGANIVYVRKKNEMS